MKTIQSSGNPRNLLPFACALVITLIMGVGITVLDVLQPKEPFFSLLAFIPGVTSIVALSASGLSRTDLYLHILRVKAQSAKRKPERQAIQSLAFARSPFVSAYVKQRANGVCQLCNSPAPFKNQNGDPYLETHHLVWLSKGGDDTIENTVALCPNCHRKMHILDLEDDKEYLVRKATSLIQ